MDSNSSNFSCLARDLLSRDSVTESEWSLSEAERGSAGVYIISTILFLCTLIGIPLNAAVLGALIHNKFWKSPSLFLLFNLALVDLLSGVFIFIFMVVPGLSGGVYTFGNSDYERCNSCQAGVVMVIWMLYTAIHIVGAMSLDRLIYIKKPLQYDKWVTVPRLVVVVIIIWLVCFVLAIPPLFGFGVIGFSPIVGTCSTIFQARSHVGPGYIYVALLVIEVTIPLGILVVSNIWLLCFVRKGIKNRFSNTYHENSNATILEVNKQAKKKYVAQQIRMVKVFGSIFISNFVTWIPIIFVLIAITTADIPPAVFGLVFLCFLVQSVIHPMIESLLSARIRKIAQKLFCRCRRREGPVTATKMSTLSNSGVHTIGK